MPELPEVETIRRALLKGNLIGQVILQVEIKNKKLVKEISSENFTTSLIGQTFHNLERKGKQLIFLLDK